MVTTLVGLMQCIPVVHTLASPALLACFVMMTNLAYVITSTNRHALHVNTQQMAGGNMDPPNNHTFIYT